MENKTIRDAIRIADLKHWEVADALNITPQTLCMWLRHELPEEKKQKILSAIEKISKKG